MKKIIISTFVLIFGVVSLAFSQDASNTAAMIQNRIAYIKNNIILDGKENQAFWKVYEQYLSEEIKIMDNYRKNLAKQGIKLGPSGSNKETIDKLTDKQLSYLQDQKFELRKSLLNLETTYYKKFKAIMSPHHLQNYYDLEYKFKKDITKKKNTEITPKVNAGKKKR